MKIKLFHTTVTQDAMLMDTKEMEIELITFVGARIEYEGKNYSLMPYPDRLVLIDLSLIELKLSTRMLVK